MRVIMLFCCIFISTISYVSHASAKVEDLKKQISRREIDSWKNLREQFSKHYNKVLKDIYKDPNKIEGSVGLLRSYYSRTGRYSPFSKAVLNKLTMYAQRVEESADSGEAVDALLKYKYYLDMHLINLDVLSFAITMSFVDVRYGDVDFYIRIKRALIKEFYRNNEIIGRRADAAYNIMSYSEETYVLEQIGGVINSSEIYEVGRKVYNVHDVTTPKGEQVQIYMDITTPITNVVYRQMLRDAELKVPLQAR